MAMRLSKDRRKTFAALSLVLLLAAIPAALPGCSPAGLGTVVPIEAARATPAQPTEQASRPSEGITPEPVTVPADWERYADTRLGISWSAPSGYSSLVVADPTARVLVMRDASIPGAVLFLRASEDPQELSGWDPTAANATLVSLPAQDRFYPAGQNPAMRSVSLRFRGRLLTLAFSYDEGYPTEVFDQILASVSDVVDVRALRTLSVVNTLSEAWSACSPSCGITTSSPAWCQVLVAASEWGGVDVYSNGGNSNNACSDYYGLKFQCVELVQRFYWELRGHDTGTGTPRWGLASAYQAWSIHPASLVPVANGSGTPQSGDILVWKNEGSYAPHGHVAIITQVSGGRVYYVQQNSSSGWGSRVWSGGRIVDDYLYGWLHYAAATDTTNPDGDITAPTNGAIVSDSVLHLEGWGSDDDSGLVRARLWASVNGYAGPWQQICPDFSTSPFSCDWDMEAAGVPDGQVLLALTLWDNAGNVAYTPRGVKTFTKITLDPRAYLPAILVQVATSGETESELGQ